MCNPQGVVGVAMADGADIRETVNQTLIELSTATLWPAALPKIFWIPLLV